LGEIVFENFNISQNNIISVKRAKVLRYIIFQKVRGRLGICKIPTYWCVRKVPPFVDLKKTFLKNLKQHMFPQKKMTNVAF
jgi:hypothetical protein